MTRPDWCPQDVWEVARKTNPFEGPRLIEAVARAILAERERCADNTLLGAAKDIISSRSSTYKARNGRTMSIEDDNGEMCWIVPFDEMFALEEVVTKAIRAGTPCQ